MAQTRSMFEGIYASPQRSRSGCISELGLTLLPSQSGSQRESHDDGGLHSGQNRHVYPVEGTWGGLNHPSPTPTVGFRQTDGSHDPPNHLVNVSNGGYPKQTLSTVTINNPNAPLFVPPRPIDQFGCNSEGAVTPRYITTTVPYRPSAPHLHTFISTGTTLAAAAQIDHLNKRNRQLTMERDRFYHLSQPRARRADDGKLQQIQGLKDELKGALELNGRLNWALQNYAARAQAACQSAANYKAQFESLLATHNSLLTGNPFIPTNQPNPLPTPSTTPPLAGENDPRRVHVYVDLTSPKKPSTSQQGDHQDLTSSTSTVADTQAVISNGRPPAPANGPQKRKYAPVTAMPATMTQAPPPSKRQRTGSNTENQSRKQKQPSWRNGSEMTAIRERVRSELKGKTTTYDWNKEVEPIQKEEVDEAATPANVASEEASPVEDELSDSDIAELEKALEEEGWDEVGEGIAIGDGAGDVNGVVNGGGEAEEGGGGDGDGIREL
jgi:hypothetical protein